MDIFMWNFIKTNFISIKNALFYENGKLSSGRMMMQVVFVMLVIFWIVGAIYPVTVPASMENVFYSLLAYVFGTKGVEVAKTAVTKPTTPTTVVQQQKTSVVDSPD